MPIFSARLNTDAEGDFSFLGSFACHGWMARLRSIPIRGSMGVPNSEDQFIEQLRICFNGLCSVPEEHREIFYDLSMRFAESMPNFKGRLSVVPSISYVNSQGQACPVTTEDQQALGNSQRGKSFQYYLPGLPTDLLMTYLFMFRNSSNPDSIVLTKYLVDKGVPLKVAYLMGSMFYTHWSAGLTAGLQGLVTYGGDSTILDGDVSIIDLRNFLFGTEATGQQFIWGGEEPHVDGYLRNSREVDGVRYNVTGALKKYGGESWSLVFQQGVAEGSDLGHSNLQWDGLNKLITTLVGKDFEITHEDANENITRIVS